MKSVVSHIIISRGLSTTFLNSRIVDRLDERCERQVVAVLLKDRCYDGMCANTRLPKDS